MLDRAVNTKPKRTRKTPAGSGTAKIDTGFGSEANVPVPAAVKLCKKLSKVVPLVTQPRLPVLTFEEIEKHGEALVKDNARFSSEPAAKFKYDDENST